LLPAVLVIGTVFLDCKGFTKKKYSPSTRNLGNIEFVHGGVGRNVAENLANLNIPTFLLSSVDHSTFGKEVIKRLKNGKVQTDYLSVATDKGLGIWLAIVDQNGDLAGSVSQMPDLPLIQETIERKGEEIVQKSNLLVLELDLNAQISESVIKLGKKHQVPIYGIPGNLDVILNHRHILKDLDCFICNNFEADLILEEKFSLMEMEQKQKSLTQFVERTGIGSMVITLGKNGAIYYDSRTKQVGYQPVFPVVVTDTSGAGDAFFSGTVMGLIRGLSLRNAVICGTKVAGWTIESSENTCRDLSVRIKQDEFFRKFNLK
jgi:pseudouridine kinase